MDIQRDAVGEVVIVKGDGFALEEILLGHPHKFKSPDGIKAESLSERLGSRSAGVAVVDRDGATDVSAHHGIVHFDEELGKFGVNYARETKSGLNMFFAACGNCVAMVEVPALGVIFGAVEHEKGGAVACKCQEAAGGFVDVLAGSSAKGRGVEAA